MRKPQHQTFGSKFLVFTVPLEPTPSPLTTRCQLTPALGTVDQAHISELNLSGTSPRLPTPLLPIEIIRKIIEEGVTTARHDQCISEGLFLSITTQCSTCCYRSLAGVCSQWREIVREIFHRSITIGERTCEDAELLRLLQEDPSAATQVRTIDASCRAKNHAVPDLMPNSPAAIVERSEREMAADIERGQHLVKTIVSLCPFLKTFDADFGHHPELLLPGGLPSTITTLTLRNVSALETFGLLVSLPNVTDLTLRLAPDWLLHEPLEASTLELYKIQLNRFEISATAWGETSFADLQTLLIHSSSTLRSLAIRNKSSYAASKFAAVAEDLIRCYGGQLTELSVRDIPRGGSRSKDHIPFSFFPTPPLPMPQLGSLHLTGVPISPSFLSSFKTSHLRHLTIEEFDDPSGLCLLATLKSRSVAELESLRMLKVCGESEKQAQMGIQEWCRERRVDLTAGWKLTEISRRWW